MNDRSRAQAPSRHAATDSGRASLRRVLWGGLAAVAVLAGCSHDQGDRTAGGVFRFLNSQQNPAMETLESTVEYAVVPPTRSMVNAPEALLVRMSGSGATVFALAASCRAAAALARRVQAVEPRWWVKPTVLR